jgi:hypothetical protein
MKALVNLRKITFVLDYTKNRYGIEKCSDDDVKRFMRLPGLDSRGVKYKVRHEHRRWRKVE